MNKPFFTSIPQFTVEHYTPLPVELRIKPLVQALDNSLIVKITSSGQGDFESDDPTRQNAFVRFSKTSWARPKDLKFLLKYLISFANPNKLNVNIAAGRIYSPWETHPSYIITVTPLCPASAPATLKRKLTDAGILEAADLVVKALRPTAKDLFNTTNTHFQHIEREIEKALN
jgi:hypothetical protein